MAGGNLGGMEARSPYLNTYFRMQQQWKRTMHENTNFLCMKKIMKIVKYICDYVHTTKISNAHVFVKINFQIIINENTYTENTESRVLMMKILWTR